MRKNLLLLSVSILLFVPFSFAASSNSDIKEVASQVSNEPAIGSIQDAMKEFKSLSKKQKRDKVKDIKKEIQNFKEQKKAGDVSTNTLLLVVLAILLPPLAVYLHEGEANGKFWLNLVLTLLFFLPGVIHALIVVLS